MSNKILIFQKVANDDTQDGFFAVRLIDNGNNTYSGFIIDQDNSGAPALASAIPASGAALVAGGGLPPGGIGAQLRRNAPFDADPGTLMEWDTIDQDDGGFFSLLAPTNIVIPQTGFYVFSAQFLSTAVGPASFFTVNGGVAYDDFGLSFKQDPFADRSTSTMVLHLDEGDIVTTFVSSTGGTIRGIIGVHSLFSVGDAGAINGSEYQLNGVPFLDADGNLTLEGDTLINGNIQGEAIQAVSLTVAPGGIQGEDASFNGPVAVNNAIQGLTVQAGVFLIPEGADATMGTGILNGATPVTILTAQVTATSRIFLSVQSPGGIPTGQLWVDSRVVGASFDVVGIAGDTSTFAWHIIEPA